MKDQQSETIGLMFFSVNYRHMATRYGNITLSVPRGFPELLGDLSREILREQPKNIPRFAAAFFQRLVEKRGGKAKLYIKFQHLIYPPFNFGLQSFGVVVKDITNGLQVLASIPGPVKSDTVSPTARHRRNFSVLPKRYAVEMTATLVNRFCVISQV